MDKIPDGYVLVKRSVLDELDKYREFGSVEQLSGLCTQKQAVAIECRENKTVHVGHVSFGPGCTIWRCPRCGAFLTPAHKYCLECGQAVRFSEKGE